jgi:hypothetical protein
MQGEQTTCPGQRPPKSLLTLGTRLYVEYFLVLCTFTTIEHHGSSILATSKIESNIRKGGGSGDVERNMIRIEKLDNQLSRWDY